MTREELDNLIIGYSGKPINDMIEKQIAFLLNEGITFDVIAKTLHYWFDVKHSPVESIEKYGIGIVKTFSVRNDALNYYSSQEKKLLKQKESFQNNLLNEEKEIVVKNPKAKVKKRRETYDRSFDF